MEKKTKNRWIKVGAVLRKGEGKKGTFVVLGSQNNKNEDFRTSVEVTVKDNKGKVISTLKNGFLTVTDPRHRPGITEEQVSKIPDRLVSELYIVEDGE